jgi:hypothetical protein
MKKVILMAAATLAVFATSFAQNTTVPAPMAKMGNKAKTKAADAATPAQQAGEKGKEMSEGNNEARGKSNDEARGGRGEGKGNNMLGLSAEQETKFKSINEAHKTAMKNVQGDASMAADAKKAEMELLKSKYESEVQSVLTTDQFAKWKAMRAKRSEPRGDRKEGGDHKEGGHKSDRAATPAPAPTPASSTAIPTAPAESMKMKNKKKSN